MILGEYWHQLAIQTDEPPVLSYWDGSIAGATPEPRERVSGRARTSSGIESRLTAAPRPDPRSARSAPGAPDARASLRPAGAVASERRLLCPGRHRPSAAARGGGPANALTQHDKYFTPPGADPGKLQGEGHESKWCPYLYPKLKTQRISATLFWWCPIFRFFFVFYILYFF